MYEPHLSSVYVSYNLVAYKVYCKWVAWSLVTIIIIIVRMMYIVCRFVEMFICCWQGQQHWEGDGCRTCHQPVHCWVWRWQWSLLLQNNGNGTMVLGKVSKNVDNSKGSAAKGIKLKDSHGSIHNDCPEGGWHPWRRRRGHGGHGGQFQRHLL
jgi:hypothetical protein